jgi:hypothetical protein
LNGGIQDEVRMTRYLLGMLTEEEQARVEQKFLAADDYYEQLLVVEDELAYRWLRNDLSREERRQYQARFLESGRGRAKMAFARALTDTAARLAGNGAAPAGSRRPFRVWMLAFAAAAILVTSLALLLVQTRELRTQVAALESQRQEERQRRSALEQELASQSKQAALPAAMFLLLPGTTRGSDELQRLQIPANANAVRLELALKRGTASAKYRAILRTADGREVWSQDGLVSEGRSVVLTVPASVLPRDEYILSLQGATPSGEFEYAAEYHFSVGGR